MIFHNLRIIILIKSDLPFCKPPWLLGSEMTNNLRRDQDKQEPEVGILMVPDPYHKLVDVSDLPFLYIEIS